MNQEENAVTCQMCGAGFSTEAELDKHNQDVHGMAPKEEAQEPDEENK